MSERTLNGSAAAEGIAIGLVFCYQPLTLNIPVHKAGLPGEALARF